MSEYHGHPEFYTIVEELKALHSEKARQYASKDDVMGNFRRVGSIISKFFRPGINLSLAACLSLMAKQVDGVYEIVGECKENTADSLEDKLRDIAVYSVLAIILARERAQGSCAPSASSPCHSPEPTGE